MKRRRFLGLLMGVTPGISVIQKFLGRENPVRGRGGVEGYRLVQEVLGPLPDDPITWPRFYLNADGSTRGVWPYRKAPDGKIFINQEWVDAPYERPSLDKPRPELDKPRPETESPG